MVSSVSCVCCGDGELLLSTVGIVYAVWDVPKELSTGLALAVQFAGSPSLALFEYTTLDVLLTCGLLLTPLHCTLSYCTSAAAASSWK